MGIIRFSKDLPPEISDNTVKLDNLFHDVFQNMVLFRDELSKHTGKAAHALKQNLDEQIDFFSQATCILMTFADCVKSFVVAVEATDEDSCSPATPMGTRSERQYQYSEAQAEEEIKLHPDPLEDATENFETRLADFESILIEFQALLDNVMANTEFPWGAVAEVWPEAKERIQYIVTEFRERVRGLINDTHNLIKELQRVDNLISTQILEAIHKAVEKWAN
ncbi:hypothetical protein P5G51_004035 [Virgibacillus sp. 179-BFC.A HS]|uniref:LXG domain-containing protein n=1 Tax=Tigheibacillus jepli TaxID=3035914 RepID=A0ABU5CGK7_9BACI|nr:hypothetical protein [Virgibacillus sp. 179-BFC.A HS]MDY0404680.1 hypothetical protein [Virgibacillus sp. 179-BFC.A HS]